MTLLTQQLPDVDCDSIGDKDIDDNDQLVFKPPCVRTRYAGTDYVSLKDNQQLSYEARHQLEIWCADEDLQAKVKQREKAKALVGSVLGIMAGARLALPDGSRSDPIQLLAVATMPQDIVGMVYIAMVAVPGIAQFPGTNG